MVRDTIVMLGGVATWGQLVAVHGDAPVRAAVRRGEVERTARGRYSRPGIPDLQRFAHANHAIVSGLSAAEWHGWPVLRAARKPWITVPRSRGRTSLPDGAAHIAYADLPTREHVLGVTRPMRTVLDCARWLPLTEALAVADSAVRRGAIDTLDLRRRADAVHGPGAARVRKVAALASPIVANPLESAARALTVRAVDLPFRPQLQVCDSGLFATVDLGNEELRIAIEVEGYAFHGGPREFARDCLRYTELVAFGWLVVRLTYTDIVHHPTWSMWAIDATVRQRRNQPISSPPSRA